MTTRSRSENGASPLGPGGATRRVRGLLAGRYSDICGDVRNSIRRPAPLEHAPPVLLDLPERDRPALFPGHSLRAGLTSSAVVEECPVQKHLDHACFEIVRRCQRRQDRRLVGLIRAAVLQGRLPCRLDQNGFSSAHPVGTKSLVLPVTTMAPWRSAEAAIIRSAPLFPVAADRRPQIRASSASKGSRRSENNRTVRSSQARRSAAKAGSRDCCWRMPRSILPSVMTLMNRSSSALPCSQAATFCPDRFRE